mgnify:CR=1 FL=1
MLKKLLPFYILFVALSLSAQDYFPKNDGVKSKNTNFTALVNAKIFITPTNKLENGVLLIQEGRVVQVGTNVKLPKNTVIIDLKGKFIYPSFIDIYSDFGIPKTKRMSGGSRSVQYGPSREGFYWNDHIRPEQNAIDQFKYDEKKAKKLLEAGFGIVNTHIQDGVVRGTGALIALDTKGSDSQRILSDQSVQYSSFSKSILSLQSYPSSIILEDPDYDYIEEQIRKSLKNELNYGILKLFDVTLRDGLQSLKKIYSLVEKTDILHNIIVNRFPSAIEVGSIVSPKILPQMEQSIALFHEAQFINIILPRPIDLYMLTPNLKSVNIASDHDITNFSFITSVSLFF